MATVFNWAWPGKGRTQQFGNIHKRYSVSAGSAGDFAAKTDTLAEAKLAGAAMAQRMAWRGKWNLMYLVMSIYRQDAPGSFYYIPAGWNMFIPVRGTGKQAEYIIKAIRDRQGVAPLTWTRKAA